MRRSACPLHKRRQEKFINAILDAGDNDKSIACHLGIGTGGRPDSICHIHSSWFEYDHNGNLRLIIPATDPCRKDGHHEPCSDCSNAGRTKYAPKSEAGAGRQLLITNTYTNHVTGDEEYFGLKDAVESYFALTGPNAPDSVRHGNQMINGDGIIRSTYTRWVRDIAAQSEIRSSQRRNQLEEYDEVDNSKIKDFGADSDGNDIPDLFGHDLRACYATQMMRNEVTPTKAITKTGHKNPSTLFRYTQFANNEIDADEEEDYF